MRCPFCGYAEDRVIESRTAREGASIRRRRECLECGRRYTTFEEIEERRPFVVKKDGRRQPYSRAKIEQSMEIACRKRPIPTSIISMAADEIERALFELAEPEIGSEQIGEMVLEKLEQIDPVAYVRFASVYREFDNAAEFGEFVHALMDASNKRRKSNVAQRG